MNNQSRIDVLSRWAFGVLELDSRVLFVRCDLRYPDVWANEYCLEDGAAISRFVDSIKAKIKAATKNKQYGGWVHYVWCREQSPSCGKPHYHVLLAFSGQSFWGLGNFERSDGNLTSRIREAWASALGCDPYIAQGLVHFPGNPCMRVGSGSAWNCSIDEVIHRGSYLCKDETKFPGARRSFQASRI
jgi:hypothetical protein